MRRFSLCLVVMLALLAVGCRRPAEPYLETFDEPGDWRVGPDVDAEGRIADGRYEMFVRSPVGLNWTTAGLSFADGLYQVEVRQTEGPLDAGYGMMIRVDEGQEPDAGAGRSDDAFYLFEISSDGFVWIGLCQAGCDEERVLVGDHWFESSAIQQGLDATNTLAIRAEKGNLIFLVNSIEVGRVTDNTLAAGDIGLLVETIGSGGVRVAFDSFQVSPLTP